MECTASIEQEGEERRGEKCKKEERRGDPSGLGCGGRKTQQNWLGAKRASDIPTRSARPQRPALCASPCSRARAVNGAADHGRVITHFFRSKYPSEPTFSLTTVPRYLDYNGAHGFVRRALSFAEGTEGTVCRLCVGAKFSV
ncbi:hypothetical protein Q8A67_025051 [Cirrhinus molitorella]|uniref:Uncharacterized protein n=1 Tax=Cirrhinus molitorella TaxID=172907 RepID=A0AA88NZ28_9TELE|nr:hypothetical protein Q8A67_025051 [Cirrhinus molitorella]